MSDLAQALETIATCLRSQTHRRQMTEGANIGDGPLTHTLLPGQLLPLGYLVEHPELDLLVLQHPLLRPDPGLQIQNPLLILRAGNRIDELLNRGKAGARGGERLPTGCLQKSCRTP